VDSQPSRSPTTNYEIPSVEMVTRLAGGMQRVEDADVDGGEVLVLKGRGFSSPTLMLTDPETGVSTSALESVTYGPSGREYVPTSVVHVSHSEIRITTAPGWAQDAYFRVVVAGQASAAGDPSSTNSTFDFARPRVLSMTPDFTASTRSPPESPQTVRLVTQSVPLSDPLSRPVITFGGITLRPTSAASNGDGTQTVSFALPEHGGGFAIPVRVGVAPIAGGASASPVTESLSMLVDGSGSASTFFEYLAPQVDRIVVTRPAWSQPGYVSDSMTLADDNCTFGPGDPFTCDDQEVRQVVILGRGFSSPEGFRADADALGLLRGDASLVPLNRFPLHVRSYTHNRALAYTTVQAGTVRVTVSYTLPQSLLGQEMTQARGLQAGSIVQRFAEGSWTNLAPSISGVQGTRTGLPTRGQSPGGGSPSEGNGLTVIVDGLDTSKKLRILAGPSSISAVPCRVWSLQSSSWLEASATSDDIKREIVDVIDQAALNAGAAPVYAVSFLVPEAPATAERLDDIRIFVDREGVLSSGDSSFAYAKPYVAGVDVWRPPSSAVNSFPTAPNAPESHWTRGLVSADAPTVSVPTRGGWIRIRG